MRLEGGMRGVPVVLALALILATPLAGAQVQPLVPPDLAAFTVRDDLTAPGSMEGAVRVLRFVQVSDAHVLDDDAPYPLRQEPLDPLGPPVEAAQRPQEEFTDEVLAATIQAVNALHSQDGLQFVLNTGDNIDNQLENELMRFIDLWEGTSTTVGPVSGFLCQPDGQSTSVADSGNDVAGACTSLPEHLAGNRTALADGLPWYSAFGNHDGLIQGNVPVEPSFQDIARTAGRRFVLPHEYVAMHFPGADACPSGAPGGSPSDDFGHGYAHAGDRLCDDDPDNDGYYAFSVAGVRFVVLDTVNDDFVNANENLQGLFVPESFVGNDLAGGYSEGSVDPAQFAWLQREVETHPDELVVVAAHHTVNSMFLDPASGQCAPLGCLGDLLREAGYATGEQVTEFLAGAPNVAGFFGGHTHRHRVQAKATDDGGFWNVESASLIDLPQEARVVELWWDQAGGKAAWVLTPFTHAFAPSKELAATDPQWDSTMPGDADDRSVVLWFDVPAEVRLVPQPAAPRALRLDLVAPAKDAAGNQAQAGDNVTLVVLATESVGPLAGAPVDGLHVAWEHPSLCAQDACTADLVSTPLAPLGNGSYAVTVELGRPGPIVAGTTSYLEFVAHDPLGRFPEHRELASLTVGPGLSPRGEESPSLGAALVLAALVAVALVARSKGGAR